MFREVPEDIKVVGCFFEGSFFESLEIKEKVAEKSIQKINLKFSENRKNEKRRKKYIEYQSNNDYD